MHLYGRFTGEVTLAVLLFTTGLQGRRTTNRKGNVSLYGQWEILKDLCDLWSLENIALIYSTYPEEELHVSQVMRQTAEMFGGMGVKVCFQKVPLPLGSQTFASVRRFSFIVLTQDEQTRCYLQQISAEYPAIFDLFKWIILMTSDTDVASFLLSLETISFRSQVVVVTMRRNIGYAADLVEWYRVVSGGPMRRQFLGQWSRPGRFIISNEDLWQRRRDLEGLQLNVDTVEDPPFVTTVPGLRGYLLDVWRALEAALNFTSRFSVVNQATLGSHERRLAANESADVLLAALTANSARRLSYLSDPIMKLRFRAYIQTPDLPYWKSFVTPFDLGICCFTGVFLVVASVMLFFSYRRSREEGPIAVTIQDAFLVIYGALLQQGSERALKSWAARLVLWLSLTFGLLLYTAYSATLISNLTVQHSTYPFLSLEQLLQSQYSVCVVRHSAAHAVLQCSQDHTVSALYQKKISTAHSFLVADVPEGLKLVSKNKAAAFLEVHERTQGYLDVLACRLVDIPANHFATYGALGIRQDLPYKNAIDYYLKKMSEGGIQKRLQRLHWWQHVRCSRDSVKSIRLRHVSVVFLYLLVGLLISATMLLCERAMCARRTGEGRCVVRRAPHSIRQDPAEGPFLQPYTE